MEGFCSGGTDHPRQYKPGLMFWCPQGHQVHTTGNVWYTVDDDGFIDNGIVVPICVVLEDLK